MHDDLVLYTDARAAIKGDLLLKLAAQWDIYTFVETGTYSGEMVKYLDERYAFDKIISIELGVKLAERAQDLFKDKRHIQIIHGDSAEVLKSLKFLDPALFWLDAHYSCGCTARGKKISPIIEELGVVLTPKDHVIVIDDLNNLPKWGVTEDMLREFIHLNKPQTTVKIIDEMMIVEPTVFGGI